MSDASNKEKRYFRVSYSCRNGFGASTVASDGMFNMYQYAKEVEQSNPHVKNVVIMGWTEMSESDFRALMKQD